MLLSQAQAQNKLTTIQLSAPKRAYLVILPSKGIVHCLAKQGVGQYKRRQGLPAAGLQHVALAGSPWRHLH